MSAWASGPKGLAQTIAREGVISLPIGLIANTKIVTRLTITDDGHE